MDEQLKKCGRGVFKPFFTELFEKYPTVQVVRWNQYTPHFNDGDPCTFSVGSISASEVALKDMPEEDRHDTGSESWKESYNDRKTDKAAQAVYEVETLFHDIEEVLNTAFGDGVEVTIERNGEVTVDDYDHD
jgi:hypothetical protein